MQFNSTHTVLYATTCIPLHLKKISKPHKCQVFFLYTLYSIFNLHFCGTCIRVHDGPQRIIVKSMNPKGLTSGPLSTCSLCIPPAALVKDELNLVLKLSKDLGSSNLMITWRKSASVLAVFYKVCQEMHVLTTVFNNVLGKGNVTWIKFPMLKKFLLR